MARFIMNVEKVVETFTTGNIYIIWVVTWSENRVIAQQTKVKEIIHW